MVFRIGLTITTKNEVGVKPRTKGETNRSNGLTWSKEDFEYGFWRLGIILRKFSHVNRSIMVKGVISNQIY